MGINSAQISQALGSGGSQRSWRLIVVGLVAAFSLYLMIWRPAFSPFDWINVLVHETGHLVFLPFANTAATAGGSILQVGLPLLLALAYLAQDDQFGASISVWWLGQSLTFLATYIGTSREGAVEFFRASADWDQIHVWLGTQYQPSALAGWAVNIGIALMVLGITAALVVTLRSRLRIDKEQKKLVDSGITEALLPPAITGNKQQ